MASKLEVARRLGNCQATWQFRGNLANSTHMTKEKYVFLRRLKRDWKLPGKLAISRQLGKYRANWRIPGKLERKLIRSIEEYKYLLLL